MARARTALKPWLKALEPQKKRAPGTETDQPPEEAGTPSEIRRRRLLMGLGAAAVVVVVVLALTREGPQSGAVITPLAEQGQVITQGEVSAAVLEVNDQFVPGDEKRRAQPGRRLIAVKFKLSNESQKTIRVKTADQFVMLDPAGHRFPANTKGTPSPLFRDGDLDEGDSREGWVSFEVPAVGTGFKMMFVPAVARPAD
ncbi:MAG: DUF4352 domain-containing protein [Actinomycetota bacterium]